MLRIEIADDVSALEPMTRVRYFDLMAEYGEEKAVLAGHESRKVLLGEMYAFHALMGRSPMPDELPSLRRIALAHRG